VQAQQRALEAMQERMLAQSLREGGDDAWQRAAFGPTAASGHEAASRGGMPAGSAAALPGAHLQSYASPSRRNVGGSGR